MFKRLYNLPKVTAVQKQRLARTLALVPSPLAKLEYDLKLPHINAWNIQEQIYLLKSLLFYHSGVCFKGDESGW